MQNCFIGPIGPATVGLQRNNKQIYLFVTSPPVQYHCTLKRLPAENQKCFLCRALSLSDGLPSLLVIYELYYRAAGQTAYHMLYYS